MTYGRTKPRSHHALFDRDHTPIDPQGGGRQDPDSVDGLWPFRLGRRQQFPWIFNPPDTYWDGASAFVRHVADVEGGFAKLKGKTIGLIYLDAPYGKEPIPLSEALAKDYGYTLKLYPVEATQMQNQTSVWLDVRRDRPDWSICKVGVR